MAAIGDEDVEGNLVFLDVAHVGNRSSPASLIASSVRFSISAESSTWLIRCYIVKVNGMISFSLIRIDYIFIQVQRA